MTSLVYRGPSLMCALFFENSSLASTQPECSAVTPMHCRTDDQHAPTRPLQTKPLALAPCPTSLHSCASAALQGLHEESGVSAYLLAFLLGCCRFHITRLAPLLAQPACSPAGSPTHRQVPALQPHPAAAAAAGPWVTAVCCMSAPAAAGPRTPGVTGHPALR
jgi:hypothetical protein